MNNYSRKCFGKDLIDLKEDDIVKFFSEERAETSTLEFKSISDPKEGVKHCREAVCSFLNSEGGILIWGAPVPTKNQDKETVCKGELTPIKTKFDRDQLINRVTDRISPMPIGISVVSIQTSDGLFLYVFEIKESPGKPHQEGGTYWIRLDGQKRPAPHYLVEAMIKQIKFPVIELFMKIETISLLSCGIRLPCECYQIGLGVILVNLSSFAVEESLTIQITPSPVSTQFQTIGENGLRKFDLFHSGSPKEVFLRVEVPSHLSRFRVRIEFMGRFSPAKTSFYEIDLDRYSVSSTDFNDLVISKKENLLIVEENESNGMTPHDIIRGYLGREI
jgi:hypothetical protein